MTDFDCWGPGTFENATAQEWLLDFQANDFRLIDRTLAGVAAMVAQDEVDIHEAAEVLAAAACIAAATGQPPTNLPATVSSWLADNAPFQVKSEYIEMARTAVPNVFTRSELRTYWAATDSWAAWEANVLDLQKRLNAGG